MPVTINIPRVLGKQSKTVWIAIEDEKGKDIKRCIYVYAGSLAYSILMEKTSHRLATINIGGLDAGVPSAPLPLSCPSGFPCICSIPKSGAGRHPGVSYIHGHLNNQEITQKIYKANYCMTGLIWRFWGKIQHSFVIARVNCS